MLELNEIHEGDCLELMARIPDGSVDMILCDLPYGTTQNKWDSIIDLPSLWAHYKRIIKPNGAIVLTAAQPFTSVLVCSNLIGFKYEWIWRKSRVTGVLNAKRQPLRQHESVLVFYSAQSLYNAQGLKPCSRRTGTGHSPKGSSGNYGAITETEDGKYLQTETGWPRSVLDIASEHRTDHPTQKPVPLFEYLIKTYTNGGEVVLDNCAGSGTTAIAALNTGRGFICIEKDPVYYAAAKTRIDSHRMFL